jgi:dolichyl-phosphate beta-glucosyltransferase
MIKSLSIVFPLFNEEKRLSKLLREIKKFSFKNKLNIEFIFVDDGSTDSSLKLLKNFNKKNQKKIKFTIISYKKNKGKGYALKKGVLKASYKWILTMDIDLSVTFSQINKWIKKKYIEQNIDIYFGSRLLINSKKDARNHRAFMGKIFNFILNILINKKFIKINDTQCGFKLYKSKFAKKIFRKIKENGYIHDIEILIISNKKKYNIKELPVKWVHMDGSKINIFRDSFKMFLDLFKLKLRYNL